MRAEGLEPSILSASDFESDVYTNSTMPATNLFCSFFSYFSSVKTMSAIARIIIYFCITANTSSRMILDKHLFLPLTENMLDVLSFFRCHFYFGGLQTLQKTLGRPLFLSCSNSFPQILQFLFVIFSRLRKLVTFSVSTTSSIFKCSFR